MGRQKTLILVDGSNLAYRAWFTNAAIADKIMRVSLESFERKFPMARTLVVYDSKLGDLYRIGLDESYKAQRKRDPLATAYERRSRKLCKRLGYKLITVKGRDGDDLLYTLAQQGVEKGYRAIIVTADKDLLMLVDEARGVSVFNPQKQIHYVTADDVVTQSKLGVPPDQVEDFLSLVGDRVDNIKGVDGVGPVKAKKILADAKELATYRAHPDFKKSNLMVRLNNVSIPLNKLPWYKSARDDR